MPPRIADFRSDTVTRPDAAQRAAMAAAVVGDDVFGDDPTVQQLEERGAQLLGKEAALFFPSGTMANQAALRTHTRPGDEVLLHEGCHVYRFEQGGLAALHGVQAVPLPGPGGQVPLERFAEALRPDDVHQARSRVVVLESTHNLSGGRVLPLEHLDAVGEFARARGLAVHLDGARLANAAVALGLPLARLTRGVDSVTLCLSKGIGAPVGTLLAGSREFVAGARRARKLLGGGMRQVGVLAAPALVALDGLEERLRRDHRLARDLARGLGTVPGLRVETPETNIVIAEYRVGTGPEWIAGLLRHGVAVVPFGPGRLRFVTHRDVTDEDVGTAIAAATIVGAALESAGQRPDNGM